MPDLDKDGNHVSIVKMESYLRRKQLKTGRMILPIPRLDGVVSVLPYIIPYDA